jgi:hypothetical protein
MRRAIGQVTIWIFMGFTFWNGLAAASSPSKMSPDQVLAFVQGLQPHRSLRLAKNAPTVSADQIRRAAAGEYVADVRIVEEVAAGQGFGVAVYDLPVAQVWKAVVDEPHFPGRLPIEQSLIVEGVARRSPRSLFQYLELPIVSDRWWVTRMRHNAKLHTATDGQGWELSWRDATHTTSLKGTRAEAFAAEGIPVAWTHGSWFLIGLPDGRTYTEYYVWSDPGGMLPAGPASRFAGGKVKEALEGMRLIAADHIPKCSARFVGPDGTVLP